MKLNCPDGALYSDDPLNQMNTPHPDEIESVRRAIKVLEKHIQNSIAFVVCLDLCTKLWNQIFAVQTMFVLRFLCLNVDHSKGCNSLIVM